MKKTLIFTFIIIFVLFISSVIFITFSKVEPRYQKDGYSDYNDVFPYRLNFYEPEFEISYDTIVTPLYRFATMRILKKYAL